MFKRLLKPLLGRRSRSAAYRQANEARSGSEPNLTTHQALEADQRVIDELTRLASIVRPSPPEAQRAQLLALLAEKKNERSLSKPALAGLRASRSFAAIAAATIILTSGVIAVSAAPGGVGNLSGNIQDALESLHITDHPPDEGDNQNGSDQHNNSSQPVGLDTPNDHANDHAGDGIDNASDQGLDHATDHALDGATSTPPTGLPDNANGNASEGSDNATQQDNNGEQQLPTQADDHADEGRGSANIPDAAPERTPLLHP